MEAKSRDEQEINYYKVSVYYQEFHSAEKMLPHD